MDHPFVKQCLENITWATEHQTKKELWHVSGILSNRSNETLKFDIDFQNRKYVKSNSKANKILFDYKDKWVLIDTKEFIYFMKNNTINTVDLDKLLDNLDWNITLLKNE
tara:strand:+ start:168 stop:494 length:327 start_codon:yes stop_codon:yes gene_type:complete